MWGCRVVWKQHDENDEPKWHEEWMWDTTANDKENKAYFPIIFTETRREIEPLVAYMRQLYNVKSAKAVKVSIPEIP